MKNLTKALIVLFLVANTRSYICTGKTKVWAY